MAPRRTYGKGRRTFGAQLPPDSPISIKEDALVDKLSQQLGGLLVEDGEDISVQKDSRQALQPVRKGRLNKQLHIQSLKTGKPTLSPEPSKPDTTSQEKVKKQRAKVEPDTAQKSQDTGASPISSSPTTSGARSEPTSTPIRQPLSVPAAISPSIHRALPPALTTHLEALLPLCAFPLQPFKEFVSNLAPHFTISKLAEASFSQVFLLSLPQKSSFRSVFKLIPLLPLPTAIPTELSRAESTLLSLCSAPSAVATETRLLAYLTNIPGFTTYKSLRLLSGSPGTAFAKACTEWNKAQKAQGKEGSYFPSFSRKTNYPSDQIWAVIEMGDAGRDLEVWLSPTSPTLKMSSDPATAPEHTSRLSPYGITALWDIFWQVVLAIGKGETICSFESRDLHCGNICVRPRSSHPQPSSDIRATISRRLTKTKGRRKLGLSGLEVTVIDYTISRATIPDAQGQGEVAFIDLNEDEALFEGDAQVEWQYEIYRCMRAAVVLDDPLGNREEVRRRKVGCDWREFRAETNVVWLGFVVEKLLEKYSWRYEGLERDRGEDAEGRQRGVGEEEKLREREREMERLMRQVQELLKFENWKRSGIRSAANLVSLAMRERWLEHEDVVCWLGEGEVRKKNKKAQRRAKKPEVKA
ncbi:Haspin like kinase domain-containing protein [Elsinoe fawcettii]|nr:Haspin like kinase domain-containing protein [Elsinoe fawcettii]